MLTIFNSKTIQGLITLIYLCFELFSIEFSVFEIYSDASWGFFSRTLYRRRFYTYAGVSKIHWINSLDFCRLFIYQWTTDSFCYFLIECLKNSSKLHIGPAFCRFCRSLTLFIFLSEMVTGWLLKMYTSTSSQSKNSSINWFLPAFLGSLR